jgi:hypothetical protein
MRTTKEAQLNSALLHYVAKCLDDGDFEALTRLGLDQSDAEATGSLALADFDHLCSTRFALLRPEAIDRDLFHRLIDYVSQLRALKGIRDELLTQDAPLTLMHHFFGMDSTEYAERGRALGLVRTVGRPSEPTEAEEAALWKAYEALNLPKGADLTPGDYLRLYKTTEIPLRTLWMVIQRWLAQGQLDVLPPPETKHQT